MKKIKVLIIDDSALVRQTLTQIFEKSKDIEVIDTASDPYIAVQKLKKEKPDVITLDIEMPRMDGITFLHKLMSQHPIPVVVISTLTDKGTSTALRALEYGAVEVVAKPKLNTQQALVESSIHLTDIVRAASKANPQRIKPDVVSRQPKLSADAIIAKKRSSLSLLETTDKVVAVGASTGGTEALKQFLKALPIDSPGVVIVQHMPEVFTQQFAKRLNAECDVHVKEAEHGDAVLRGHVLIAPGSHHMLLKRNGAKYFVQLKDGPLVNRHRPSVDVLFRSVARYAGVNAIAIIMTGMGDDGAKGLLEIKNENGYTIAQDEATCVVFGMPKEAIKLGAHHEILPLQKVAAAVMKWVKY